MNRHRGRVSSSARAKFRLRWSPEQIRGGPTTVHTLYHPDGSRSQVGPAEREYELADLTGHVHRIAAEAPFWPGDNLAAPPREPHTMPYQPYES